MIPVISLLSLKRPSFSLTKFFEKLESLKGSVTVGASILTMVLDPIFAFHNAQWVLYYVLLQLALVCQPSPYRRLFFLPILALTVYTAYSTKGGWFDDYFMALQWTAYLCIGSDFILLTDVQKELHQLTNSKNGIKHASRWERICWANSLFFSFRGVGWAHEPVEALPPHPPLNMTRPQFVLGRLKQAIMLFLLHDLANLHVRANDMFHPDGPGWRSNGWFWQITVVASWGLSVATMLCCLFVLLSMVAVGLGLSEPNGWPALMRSPREAYTIRRFWGRAWHQLLRRFVTAHGKYLTQALRFPRGSNASAYTQLFVAFFVSAIVHYGAEVFALRNWGGGALTFFMLQPFAIVVEDFLIWVGQRMGWNSPAWRYVGYITTLGWFVWVTPIWQEPLIREGEMASVSLPVSLLMGVWKGQWMLPPFPELATTSIVDWYSKNEVACQSTVTAGIS
ncbi:MBOAT-2 domain-containing protein [Mycena indigotica]|uniref:MBOAT-2 domain-containing protein n=1 Tax=Mycena indigotica TaxID=2126181 RepID=A0A8H6TC56_9AGAR|nr:MBOAT-2 domain-containing protein [Mycena indigotica]KAF7316085.1 MBOAT-2 domain-containing protein [Mycena indigotica]